MEILSEILPGALFSEAENGEEVLKQLAESEYTLLLLDINMPGRNGMDVLADVKHNYARMPVVMVSVQPVEQYCARCLRAGAAAYINKDSAPEELVQVIKNILSADRDVNGLHPN